MDPLQQATTDELLAELKVRWPRMIFAAEKDSDGDPDCDDTIIRCFGGMNTAIGLAYRTARFFERSAMNDEVEEDGADA